MYIGRVQISQELLLQWLQLEGGEIKAVSQCPIWGHIEFAIEHTEMPTVPEGGTIPIVDLLFTRHQDSMGHSVAIREPIKFP